MVAPDRREITNTFRIMPHPIRVDEMSTTGGNHVQHASINMIGHARNQLFRWLAHALRPVAAHQIMITANTTRSDNHRLSLESELTNDHPRTWHATLDIARFQHLSVNTIHYTIAH